MTDRGPSHIGPQPLAGYVMRDYEQLTSTLYRSRESQRLTLAEVAARIGCHLQAVSVLLRGDQEARGRRLFDLVHAVGYDLALIPREDA